jgi:hypothetical protein
MTVKTKPLWRALSGPAETRFVETPQHTPVLGAKFSKLVLPIGKHTIELLTTREVADAVQRILSLDVVDYDAD